MEEATEIRTGGGYRGEGEAEQVSNRLNEPEPQSVSGVPALGGWYRNVEVWSSHGHRAKLWLVFSSSDLEGCLYREGGGSDWQGAGEERVGDRVVVCWQKQ